MKRMPMWMAVLGIVSSVVLNAQQGTKAQPPKWPIHLRTKCPLPPWTRTSNSKYSIGQAQEDRLFFWRALGASL
jgi:hypothetical protein